MTEKCCPEVPECCDMRGMLSFMILWLLTKGSMNGQQLAKEIAQRRGSKPSPGTIYPALKDLNGRGLIKGTREGRTIMYTLTDQGKDGIEQACQYFCQAFGEIFEEYK